MVWGLKFFRVYLKTHDVTGSEGFLRCARHFFAGILTYFKEKWRGAPQKGLLSGCVGSFQIHPSLQCFVNSCSASEKDVRLTCFAFKIVVLRIKNPPFPRQKIWRQNGGKNLVSRFSNAEKTEFLIKKNSSNSEESEELCFHYTIDECRNLCFRKGR